MGLDEVIAQNSIRIVLAAGAFLVILAAISLKFAEANPTLKKILYILIAAAVILPTFYLASSTIYLNNVSSSKGPVHWHADFEIYNCGQEVELVDPKGFSNKVGTATLHEHNDKRIHLEGVVVERLDASLGKFFKVIGGELTSNFMVIPTNGGPVKLIDGQECNGEPASLQVFIFKVEGQNYSQTKPSHPANYVISPHSQVPPGDCIIVEFAPTKDRTDKLCRSYQVAKEIGKLGEEEINGN